jgi:hypothetical protein
MGVRSRRAPGRVCLLKARHRRFESFRKERGERAGVCLQGVGGAFESESDQAYKGARGMPRHGQAMKGVVSCEKHRGAARRL